MIWRRNEVFCLDVLHLRCLLTSAWKGWVVLDMSQKFQGEVTPGAIKLNWWHWRSLPKVRVTGKEIQGLSPGAFQFTGWGNEPYSLLFPPPSPASLPASIHPPFHPADLDEIWLSLCYTRYCARLCGCSREKTNKQKNEWLLSRSFSDRIGRDR